MTTPLRDGHTVTANPAEGASVCAAVVGARHDGLSPTGSPVGVATAHSFTLAGDSLSVNPPSTEHGVSVQPGLLEPCRRSHRSYQLARQLIAQLYLMIH